MNNRWVTQTKFYDPSQPPEVCTGNCTEAALASLFGIRLEDVPSMQGLVASDYWEALDSFVCSRGYALSMQPASHRPAGLYLADGPSARGCGHFVVMRDGKMVHDPHPSAAGLLEVEHVWSLMVLDPAAHLHPQPAELAEQQGDVSLNTSEGGRRYVADFFARELRRHDFTRYITTTLAADFACALAQHLAATGKQQVGEAQGDALALIQRYDDARAAYREVESDDRYDDARRVELRRALTDARNKVVFALAARQPVGNVEQLDRALGETIDQRDRYHEVADDLAAHIERITGVEIGEHSSDNCPWQNAIEAAEGYAPAQSIGTEPDWIAMMVEFIGPGALGHMRRGFEAKRDAAPGVE